MGTTARDRTWWKEAVVYQIYPRSFNDSDGDGIGDIPGIIEKVDYLEALGVDVVWLCPVYDSPQADNGYDIRDYRTIDDQFGDMADWERLREELHARDIRLIMDLVVNHTSDEHAWFRRSRDEEDGYADYYWWVEGDPDQPPNNWRSFFGGPAWSYDDRREAWYLHLFHEKQPDLNWRNPAVRADIKELMRWWLEKGIDGFRMDAINLLSKPADMPDGDPAGDPVGAEHVYHGPRVLEYLTELSDDVLSDYDALTVAEMDRTTPEIASRYLGADGAGLSMIFHFEHMNIDHGPRGRWDHEDYGEWDLTEFKTIMSRWATELTDGWNSVYLGNHDQPRIVSRFGDDGQYREASAKLLATFLLTMRGTPYVYQGEEIGMTNSEFTSLSEMDDPMTIGPVEDMLAAGDIGNFDDARGVVNYMSRDHARTPMQWTAERNAGFTDGTPWLSINDDADTVNVAAARTDPDSIWQYYRELIALRQREETLVYGDYELLVPEDEQIYAYTRSLESETLLVVLNWSADPAAVDVSVEPPSVLLANTDEPPAAPTERAFQPYEAVVYRL